MARVKAWRDARGITSEFWRHGKFVDMSRLQRLVRLHQRKLEELLAEDQSRDEPIEALLPPHIVVLSTSSPLVAVCALEPPEKIFMSFGNFLTSAQYAKSPSRSEDARFLYWDMERNSKMPIAYCPSDPSKTTLC